MASRPEGPPPPPAVRKIRVRYAKRGRLRIITHRDFQRSLERALRRSDSPMAYSEGFSPHPKISYAGAAPTGTASEAEYLELGLAEERDPEAVRAALNAALPEGMQLNGVAVAGAGSLADRINASRWLLRLEGVAGERAEAAVSAFVAAEAVPVQRVM